VNAWLVTALVMVATMLPLCLAAFRRRGVEGVPALQVAGLGTSMTLVLLAIGLDRQLFVDLALVTGLLNFAGTVAFAAVLGRPH
jgi:multisubunit Na+/H+ antiporter MnhF subunit